ncbi:hypothetical protein FM104_04600 [Microbacterium esteraromaticum]|uniref:Septum formation-related domain-containing protein n=1 Tax=Microbacterium esteraromaticum TaxID=57043 RepID=A0A1R4IYY8_9MICO|nr:septum formation family protein [Microbacterium esteraromaticum]SJN24795.1 hypothetical protein FM104_04600 [Microbacterium esteraromaticum]
MSSTRIRRGVALTGAALALSLALTGCSMVSSVIGSGGSGGDAKRDDSGQVEDAQNIDIFNLKVGDCKLSDSEGEVQATDVVACDTPHDEEVYYEFDLDGDDFPDAAVIEDAVRDNCIPEFETYVGVPWEESSLDIRWLEPTAQTWKELGDRVVQCIIIDGAGGSLDASMKNAKI